MKSADRRNVTSRRLLIAAAACLIASPALALEPPQAAALAGKILETRRGAVIRARGRMVVTDAHKQQRVFQIVVLQKRLARSVNLLWSVTGPPEARMRVLVESPFEGRPAVWLVSGEAGNAARLPPEKWGNAILNSHLSFEDLVDDYFAWPKQSVTGEEAMAGKLCYVLRSDAPPGHSRAYGSVTSWVDQATLVPLRITKEPSGAGVAKEIVCRGVRRSAGHWTASNIEFRIRGEAGSTRIVFTAGSENARVKDSEVDPRLALGASGASH